MMSFKSFLNEELGAFKKLSHLEHVEDTVLHGKEGFEHAHNSLNGVSDRLAGMPGPSVSTKFDGSPTIVFGRHPATGKFFVGTKGALSKNPTIAHTQAEVDDHYSSKPGLHQTMSRALEHLPKVAPAKGIYQGDFMYHKDKVHEGTKTYDFTPNTVMYSVKKSSDEGKKIKNAQMGIAVHTQYHGHDFASMRAAPVSSLSNFGSHKDVHIIDPDLKIKTPSKPEHAFKHEMKLADNAFIESHPDTFKETAGHRVHLQSYLHTVGRENVKPTAAGFKSFLTQRNQKEAEKFKTPGGKLRSQSKLLQHLSHVDQHHDKYESLLTMHHHLQQAKNHLIAGLARHNEYEATINGEPSQGEGFVVTHNDHPTKLVNREEFTKTNRERHIKEDILQEHPDFDLPHGHKMTDVSNPRFPDTHEWHVHDQHGKRVGSVSTYHYPGIGHTINSIDAEGARGIGLGRHMVKHLAKHFGAIHSDPQANTSNDAVHMWSTLGAKKIPTNKNTKGYHYKLLSEGGDVEIGEHHAQPIHVTAENRPKIQHDIDSTMKSIHDTFHKEHGHHLFGHGAHAILHGGSAYSGSTKHLMTDGISHKKFAQHKPMVGDIDVQIPHEHAETLRHHLQPGRQFGPYHVVGVKNRGSETTALMKHHVTGHVHQFDFEHVKYEHDEPAHHEQFSHSSDWTDTQHGIKGKHHKMLLHSVASTQGKKYSITHGVRRKLDATEGKKSAADVSKSLFGTLHSGIHSFHGVTQLIKQHIPKEHHQAIYNKFKEVASHGEDVTSSSAVRHLRDHLSVKNP